MSGLSVASRLTTPPPKQNPTVPTLPVDSPCLEIGGAGYGRRDHVLAFRLGVKLARLVLVGGRAAIDGQQIGRQRQKAFRRVSAGDILDVGVQSPVLVDDEHGRPLALVLRPHQVTADFSLRRIIGHAFSHKPGVVGHNDRGLGVVVRQQRHQRGGSRGRADQLGEPVEKLAPVHAAMGEMMVEVDDALIHDFAPR